MKPKIVYGDGQMVGATPYRVVRFLGGGGMGTVYEVEDTTVGKLYVLKTLHSELAHRADLARMLRQEARLLAKVKHKNIVDVITAGKTGDAHDLPFIVMEKLDGITLKGLMQTHRLPWQFVRQIANELLEALYRMHHPSDDRLPMIHRDIKPENIFLAKDDDGKYITKLLDLGIASWLDGQKQQGFHGTLKYAAAEQLSGGPLTEKTDLYQAALVFFEMLTGRHPFADAKTEAEMIEASLMRAPPRVSEFADVPRRVDDVIDAALSKTPSKRPRDAYFFMTALQGLREQASAHVPELANTTIEELHTAIARQTETGYEAYATSEGSTLEGMSAPPFETQTLEDAYPSFAVASTDAPRQRPAGTVPMAQPVLARPEADGVDRRAATREQPKGPPRRAAHNDTEELLDGLMPAELAELRERARQERAEPLPWTREPPRTSSSRVSEAPRAARHEAATVFDPSTATPMAAEVAPQPRPDALLRRRAMLAAAAGVIFVGALGAHAVVGGARNESGASRRSEPRSEPRASSAPSATAGSVAPAAVAVALPSAVAAPAITPSGSAGNLSASPARREATPHALVTAPKPAIAVVTPPKPPIAPGHAPLAAPSSRSTEKPEAPPSTPSSSSPAPNDGFLRSL